jgi:2-polyprenyl-3-methyl-5-hydroxy-6-metoxy-1,4-benzoquinol methylase
VNASLRDETPSIAEVRDFWEHNPCGHETSEADDRLRYFKELEEHRYRTAPWIPEAADFGAYRKQRVLEVGCGMGTDGAQFAAAGAEYTGVDLTEAAVALARENFELRGLRGDFTTANAEELPFPNETFDHVYSFGVIHHTTNPEAIVAAIHRVLKPGGTVTVMLYNRTSINYYVEILVLRRLGRALLSSAAAPAVLAKMLRLPKEKLEGHRDQLLRIPHPTPEQWISMNTDGPHCPLARVYSAREAHDLFASFRDFRTRVFMFDRSHWPFVGSMISDSLAETIGRRVGWNRMIYARK